MAQSLRVLSSLDTVSSGYSVFEQDQVLTHEQLNSVSAYLDDQDRLTRVGLIGVGIACGLNASVADDVVVVTRGAGVTTDGDLLHFETDMRFDRFKPYDESAPVYDPFYADGKMLTVRELVPEGVEDARATGLDQLSTETGSALLDKVVVLYMESYVKDEDLCSGTDCDNLGCDSVNNTKVLLVDKATASALRAGLVTMADAAAALADVAIPRPKVSGTIASGSDLANLYRSTCTSMVTDLTNVLSTLYATSSAVIADLFPDDPTQTWLGRLKTIDSAFARSDFGIQYYYDFLKDVVETYGAFRDQLFGDTTVCCPDVHAFPKHLLLGYLASASGTGTVELRTGYYPSPITSRTSEQWAHARSLAVKLHTLLSTFATPKKTSVIRVTPSACEDRSLEERAIPYYYDVNTTLPVHRAWSYELTRRGMEAYNYSYNASLYSARGAAASPLDFAIGRYPFFRIEGHLGQAVNDARTSLEAEIASNNLPFAVDAVLLGSDRSKLVKKPGIRYTDLHRMHHLLRQDVYYQLDDAVTFGKSLTEQVNNSDITDISDGGEGPSLKELTSRNSATVTAKATTAMSSLAKSYSNFRGDSTWKSDFKDIGTVAGTMKTDLGSVMKTEFTTPLDSLIGNTQVRWLDWLDEIIATEDDRKDEQSLFAQFIQRRPGLEHFAGVVRGGTFVLVYDDSGSVLADFMLPYNCCEADEEETEQPVLTRPQLKVDDLTKGGFTLDRSLTTFVGDELSAFQGKIEPLWKEDIETQASYFDVFKDSVTLMSNTFTGINAGISPGNMTAVADDTLLDLLAQETQVKTRQVEELRTRYADPDTTDDERTALEGQLKNAELGLAKTVEDTVAHVAATGADVSKSSEGNKALTTVSDAMLVIKDPTARDNVKAGLERVSAGADAQLKSQLGAMSKIHGL
jgi:hypothetical protein